MTSAIGVDIGGTAVKAARVGVDGAIRAEAALPTANSPAAVLRQVDALIERLDANDVEAIGVGAPGRVDARSGRALSGGFVDLSGPPLSGRLARLGGRALAVDNDASMALVAESRLGAAKGLEHVVLLTIGTGVGGAAMENGRLVHGRGSAGQLGHIAGSLDGAPCKCGRRGCLETLASGTALRGLIEAAGLAPATTIEDLLAREDAIARDVVARWSLGLRAGVDSLVAAFDPQCVVLGGGLGGAACLALARSPALSPWFQCPVLPAKLGQSAGVVGAALAALERLH